MPAGLDATTTPRVSIILPTYNRAGFLPAALESIQAQTFGDWELIVVDDGSSDDTRTVTASLAAARRQPIRYLHQANQGAGAARNSGVAIARGAFLAFFDSDDLWLPHHLADSVAALEANVDVDWVYGACEVVDLGTGHQIDPSTFYPRGQPHPFLSLSTESAGTLKRLTDPATAECMIAHGLMCGLQCSVMRRAVFEAVQLPLYRTVHDQIFVVLVLKAGFQLGYFDNVHAVYRVHDDSVSARDRHVDKAIAVLRELLDAWQTLPQTTTLSATENRQLRRRLADESFWTLGYSLLWQNGRRAEALRAYRVGLGYQPFDYRMWKTYAAALVRISLSSGGAQTSA